MTEEVDMQPTTSRIPVLCYHSIGNEERDGTLHWSVAPAMFDEQMALLVARGRTPLTVSDYAATLQNRSSLPPRPVLVTFDDGFDDLATAALPILRKHGIAATAFLISSRIGTPKRGHGDPMLDWDQVAELRTAGMEIGSHSHTHRALDTLTRADAMDEIRRSKEAIEDQVQQPVASFAYPYGYHSATVRRQVIEAGYTSACAVKNALSHPADDAFAIARILIDRTMGVDTIDGIIDGRDWPTAWSGERLRTRGWRAYRRVRGVVRSAERPSAAADHHAVSS